MTYIAGDYWMECQRTGIKFRRSEMRAEPVLDQEGYQWVHHSVLNPPHPQDFVRVPAEDPSVYPANPSVEQLVGETTLSYAVLKWSRVVTIPSSMNAALNDGIGITMNDGMVFWDFIQTIDEDADPLYDSNGELLYDSEGYVLSASDSNDVILISRPIFSAADAGNVVYIPSVNNEEWQT